MYVKWLKFDYLLCRVTLKEGVSESSLNSAIETVKNQFSGVQLVHRYDILPGFAIQIPETSFKSNLFLFLCLYFSWKMFLIS